MEYILIFIHPNMLKVQKAFSLVLVSVLAVSFAAVIVPSKAKAQALPPSVTAYSSISVKVNGVSASTLYDFVTDLQNDPLWFPNVAETEVVNPGGANGVGKIYIQRSYFNGIPLDSTVEVKSAYRPWYYYIEGAGPVATYKALYTFYPTWQGGVFTLSTEFTAPGIDEPSLTYLLNTAMQNILNHYSTTGTIKMNFFYI